MARNRKIDLTGEACQPWIGLVHVRAEAGKHPFAKKARGAYVNVVALASSTEEFRQIVQDDLLRDDLVLVDTEEVDTVEVYRSNGRISQDLSELVESLSKNEPVKYDVFSLYKNDDA